MVRKIFAYSIMYVLAGKRKNRLRSQGLQASCSLSSQFIKNFNLKDMSQCFSRSTPDKPNNSSAILNSSTQSENVNLNVVLNN